MSAPWVGDLYVQDTPFPNLKNAADDDGTWIAANCKSEYVEALVHRANAYPKLVDALRKAEAALLTARMSVPESHYPEMVEAHREVAAALASTREEGA